MKISSERGSAVLDFVLFGVVIQVGLLIFATQIFGIQANQLAAESISRHGLRAYILSDVSPEVTSAQVLSDFGISKPAEVALNCDPNCTGANSVISLKVVVGKAEAVAVAIR